MSHEYNNPLYHWWKARKYFKRPKCHFICGKNIWFFGLPIREDCWNPIIDFRISALGWKSKYNSPRHEWDPYICISLFRKWKLVWIFNWISKKDPDSDTRSMATWEAILDMLYFKKSLAEVLVNHVWTRSENDKKITINKNVRGKR